MAPGFTNCLESPQRVVLGVDVLIWSQSTIITGTWDHPIEIPDSPAPVPVPPPAEEGRLVEIKEIGEVGRDQGDQGGRAGADVGGGSGARRRVRE